MKYIRAQNGEVLSISRLIPPQSRAIYHPSGLAKKSEHWVLRAVAVCGHDYTYATYDTAERAQSVFEYMLAFLYSEHSLVIFELGDNGTPERIQPSSWASGRRIIGPLNHHHVEISDLTAKVTGQPTDTTDDEQKDDGSTVEPQAVATSGDISPADVEYVEETEDGEQQQAETFGLADEVG